MREPKVGNLHPAMFATSIQRSLTAMLATGCMAVANSQELDVPYVETPEEVIGLMLDMAGVGRGDYVVDLGTGDGRIVNAAAKLGAVGMGVDLDPRRVEEANANAVGAGVSNRVFFYEQDLFDTDFSEASVVTMFLNSEVNLKLRPTLLRELEPGARVVSHNFDMEEWQPDRHQQFLRKSADSFFMHDVYCWIIPADVGGRWRGETDDGDFEMTIEQKYQKIKPDIRIGNRPLMVEEASLYGRRINIIAIDRTDDIRYIFSGSAEDDDMVGTVQSRNDGISTAVRWRASRKQ
jgi:SAM-dependent methyltransferase